MREKNHLSQKEFGKVIGFSQGNVGDWERGRSLPSTKAIISIIDKFNVTSDWLLLGRDKFPEYSFPVLKKLNQKERVMLNTYAEFLLFNRSYKERRDGGF